jgi:hypothetical protein
MAVMVSRKEKIIGYIAPKLKRKILTLAGGMDNIPCFRGLARFSAFAH